MEQSAQSYAAYTAASQHTQPAPTHIGQIHAPINEPAWHNGNISTSTASTPPGQASPMFSVVNRAPDLQYPSPAPSIASPPYAHHHQQTEYASQQQPPGLHSSSNDTMLSFPQVESSIGPSRVRTRRQRAALEQNELGRRASMPPAFQRQEQELNPQHNSTIYLTPTGTSRPQTPNSQESDQFQSQRDRLSLNIASAVPSQLQSPTYNPMTPTSLSSPFSSYSLYPGHSRSTSGSTSNNQRSASPALSNVSALTSASSSASVPSAQSFVPYPRPQNNAVSALLAPRIKQRKQRLYNVDRKAICIFHMQYPNARQEDIAVKYGVERSTISKILKNKTKWLNTPSHEDDRVAKHRPSKFPEIEEELLQWLEECSRNKTILTDALIRSKAKETAKQLQIPEEKFKASSGWVENFKHRHGIRAGVWSKVGKHTQVARALGDGVGESVLSPLNPAFDGREDRSCEMNAASVPDDGGFESDGSLDPDDRRRDGEQHLVGSQPVGSQHWPEGSHDVSSRHPMSHSDASHLTAVDESLVQHHQPQAIQLAPHQHGVEHDNQSHIPQYEQSTIFYQPAPLIPDHTPPTLADAEEAINRLITFLDSTGQGILEDSERQALNTIKCALFQAASGVPFDRSRR